jgi:Flp pilus assembly protein TadB
VIQKRAETVAPQTYNSLVSVENIKSGEGTENCAIIFAEPKPLKVVILKSQGDSEIYKRFESKSEDKCMSTMTRTHAAKKNKEALVYWTYIVCGFLVLIGIEILLHGVPLYVSILAAAVVVALLIWLYKVWILKD